VSGHDEAFRHGVARRAAELRALHREVRIALATTATVTERALRDSAATLDIDLSAQPQRRGHRFFTEND
jgi:hypothetical protein